MPIELRLEDKNYPFTYTDHVRLIARAFVLDEENRIAIHQLHRNDKFGDQWYYETPGGGVDEGETFELAVIRECEEEIGCDSEIIAYLGEVIDYYNLIHRENHNRFFLLRKKEMIGKHYASKGDYLIQKTVFLPYEELLRLYEQQEESGVAGIVKNRELPMLQEAIKIIKSL